MTRFASAIAALALVSAAAPVAAQDARIRFGDLDLSSASGAAAFDARIEAAATKACQNVRRPASRISDREACAAALRQAAMADLPRPSREAYAAGRRLPSV